MLADTEFSTVKFFNAVREKSWRIVVGVRNNRKHELPHPATRGWGF